MFGEIRGSPVLGLHPVTAEGEGLIFGWGTKSP